MFSDNPNIIKYADEVYLYKNFISKEDVAYINELMEPHREKENAFSTDVNTVDWYNDKEGPQMPEPYGVCVYFGEFEGGELFYPHIQSNGELAKEEHIDDYLVVPVQPGDLAIHWAQSPYEHGTKPVSSGIRYVYSNFALRAEKNPGTFPAWGTQEDLDRKANGTWMQVICDKHKH